METKAIADLQPGVRLAKAVYSAEGKLLFPVGETLTRDVLATLKTWGVTTVNVFEEDAPNRPSAAAVLPEDMMDAVRETVGRRFRLQDIGNPYIATLFDLAVELEGRAMLSRPGKSPRLPKPSPAFHTSRPEPTNVETLIAASGKMGTLPMVFHRLVEIINSPYASPADSAKIIATDPALSAKLLRLVNSPFYGLATRIDTISRAVVLVGTGQLVMLAMGATLMTAFKGMPISLVNMQSFWNHSIACGVAARLLARHLSLPQPETWFVSGLLHDIGRLLVYTQLPTHALYLLTEARRRDVSIYSLETDTLGFTHEALGEALLRSWRCPEEIVRRIGRHHFPLAEDAEPEDAVLPIANLLAQGLGYGSSGEQILPEVSPRAWELADLTPEALLDVSGRLDDDVRDMRSVLNHQE
jgi:putative nucleotidyltransferase with HDIG domain